jgi:hypothetical protein
MRLRSYINPEKKISFSTYMNTYLMSTVFFLLFHLDATQEAMTATTAIPVLLEEKCRPMIRNCFSEEGKGHAAVGYYWWDNKTALKSEEDKRMGS